MASSWLTMPLAPLHRYNRVVAQCLNRGHVRKGVGQKLPKIKPEWILSGFVHFTFTILRVRTLKNPVKESPIPAETLLASRHGLRQAIENRLLVLGRAVGGNRV